MTRHRGSMVVLALLVVAAGVTGCDLAKVGARCKAGATARNATHVLVCQKGRWAPLMNFQQLGMILREPTRTPLVDVEQVAVGLDTLCARRTDGTVVCSGRELGTNRATDDWRFSAPIAGITAATDLSVSDSHACAVVAGGKVRCWGLNFAGQLGNGGYAASRTPGDVVGLSNVTDISVGLSNSCAIVTAGNVQCWGSRYLGLRDDMPYPVVVEGVTGATAIAVGYTYVCAVVPDGVSCWGTSQTYSSPARVAPALVPGIGAGVRSLSVSGSSACAVLADRSVRCWGVQTAGQFDGTYNTQFVATPVTVPDSGEAAAVSVSSYSMCVLRTDSSVVCGGFNSAGQLGDGTRVDRGKLGGEVLRGATSVAVSWTTSCAVLADRGLRCWGDSLLGQIDGFVAGILTPRQATYLP